MTLVSRARKTIEEGTAFDGAKVEADLFPQSLLAVEVLMRFSRIMVF